MQQMAGAKDLDDARGRASQILQAFEQAVLQQAFQVRTPVTMLTFLWSSLAVHVPLTELLGHM